ncbi:unnamed protein product [Lepeophtheirus salmonis]|uniref:(salmon louse) hypothetical protein n=1 Tax=Lepeophtheirus salmonis TaxID=72036 RepID=A0A7R8CE83_LEPSM|nr:unnamed protein product [Lepeophtheirus salmonis]CAF2792907.1 unnamed protein product [Lepeophtheirus salmonis]
MKYSHTQILFLGIVISIKTGYSQQIKDSEDKGGDLSGFKTFNDQLFDHPLQENPMPPLHPLRSHTPLDDEEGYIRQSRAGYLFRTRKDPNKKDRMYLFRTKKDPYLQDDPQDITSRLMEDEDDVPNEVEEGTQQLNPRERRDGSNFYFRTRKGDGNRSPRGGYYFRTRSYFLRTRKDPGSSAAAYWFRNRRGDENNEEDHGPIAMEPPEKRGYFFRTRKLRDWDNFERNLRGRSYFLRT